MEFAEKYIEIRPSGTDAKTKAYGGGLDKQNIEKYTYYNQIEYLNLNEREF